MDINQVGVVLMGTVLGWFLMFAVRRYKVQWGAFAAFMAIVFGVSMLSFLYARDLLAYYGIGIFLGFVSNLVVRVAGTTGIAGPIKGPCRRGVTISAPHRWRDAGSET